MKVSNSLAKNRKESKKSLLASEITFIQGRGREDKFPTFNLVWYSGTCQRPWDTILVGHPLLFFRKLDLEDDLETKIGKVGIFLWWRLQEEERKEENGATNKKMTY